MSEGHVAGMLALKMVFSLGFLVTIVLGVITNYRTYSIRKMVEAGNNPLIAAMSVRENNSSRDVLCAQIIARGRETEEGGR